VDEKVKTAIIGSTILHLAIQSFLFFVYVEARELSFILAPVAYMRDRGGFHRYPVSVLTLMGIIERNILGAVSVNCPRSRAAL
jgi:hypothetical protein